MCVGMLSTLLSRLGASDVYYPDVIRQQLRLVTSKYVNEEWNTIMDQLNAAHLEHDVGKKMNLSVQACTLMKDVCISLVADAEKSIITKIQTINNDDWSWLWSVYSSKNLDHFPNIGDYYVKLSTYQDLIRFALCVVFAASVPEADHLTNIDKLCDKINEVIPNHPEFCEINMLTDHLKNFKELYPPEVIYLD